MVGVRIVGAQARDGGDLWWGWKKEGVSFVWTRRKVFILMQERGFGPNFQVTFDPNISCEFSKWPCVRVIIEVQDSRFSLVVHGQPEPRELIESSNLWSRDRTCGQQFRLAMDNKVRAQTLILIIFTRAHGHLEDSLHKRCSKKIHESLLRIAVLA